MFTILLIQKVLAAGGVCTGPEESMGPEGEHVFQGAGHGGQSRRWRWQAEEDLAMGWPWRVEMGFNKGQEPPKHVVS